MNPNRFLTALTGPGPRVCLPLVEVDMLRKHAEHLAQQADHRHVLLRAMADEIIRDDRQGITPTRH